MTTFGCAGFAHRAEHAAPASPAASLGLFVYPAKAQDAAQQSKDETECYDWSKTQSGFDPARPPRRPAAAAPAEKQGPGGERIKGAARGAAAGAVIGEVADNDASEGAEVGAAAGVLAGGRQARKNRSAQEEQAAGIREGERRRGARRRSSRRSTRSSAAWGPASRVAATPSSRPSRDSGENRSAEPVSVTDLLPARD